MASRIAISFAFVLFATALLPGCKEEGAAPPIDASTVDAGACAGTVAYLAACTADDECMSCTCKSFGHSRVCSKACTVDTECPAPSGGCSMGFCRP